MISSPNEPALLSGVNSPADLRRLAFETLPDLAEELRRFLPLPEARVPLWASC